MKQSHLSPPGRHSIDSRGHSVLLALLLRRRPYFVPSLLYSLHLPQVHSASSLVAVY
jgi:hypothetical protein